MPNANESGAGGQQHSKHVKGRKPSSSRKDADENSADYGDDLARRVFFPKSGGDSEPVGACLRAGAIVNKDGGGQGSHVAIERGASLPGTTAGDRAGPSTALGGSQEAIPGQLMTMMNGLLDRLGQLKASSTQASNKTKKHSSKGRKAKQAKATSKAKASKGDRGRKRKAHDSETDDDESDQCWVQSSDDTDSTSGGEQTSDDQYEKLGAVFGPAGSSAGAQPDGDATDSAFAKALKDLSQLFQCEEDTGPDINVHFANIFDATLRRKPSLDFIDKICKKYARPGNIANMVVPKTNNDVWANMRKGPRIVDMELQKVQLTLLKGLGPLLSFINDISTGKAKQPQEYLESMNDALRLVTAAFSSLSQTRKDVIRNDVCDFSFAKLCMWDTPVGQMDLFGVDVLKKVDEIRKSKRIGKDRYGQYGAKKFNSKFSRHYNQYQSSPYNNKRRGYTGFGNRRRPDFLGHKKFRKNKD